MRIQVLFVDGEPWKAIKLDSKFSRGGKQIFKNSKGYYFVQDGYKYYLGQDIKEYMEIGETFSL